MLPVLASDVVVDLVAHCDTLLYRVISNVLITSPLQNLPDRWATHITIQWTVFICAYNIHWFALYIKYYLIITGNAIYFIPCNDVGNVINLIPYNYYMWVMSFILFPVIIISG